MADPERIVDDAIGDLEQQPATTHEKQARIGAGVQAMTRLFNERNGENMYDPYSHDEFEMVRPLHFFSVPVAREEEEETKSDEPEQRQVVAAFFDPFKHLPSNEPIKICRTGLIKFAYHSTVIRSKRTGALKTSNHPVAFKIMDKEQLREQQEDTLRERRVMQALRREGFRTTRVNLLEEPDIREHAEKASDYFPQWRFFEDEHNQYMTTDFASNGSLVQYAKKRFDSYSLTIAELMSTAMILDGFPVAKAVTKLWREEAHLIFAGIAQAVVSMHENGVCHLDLDVCNIVIDSLGNPIIVDFGSSEVAGEDRIVGRGRPILCKPHFGAPEIRAHNRKLAESPGVDGRAADMFSLGVILYWLLFLYQGEGAIIDPVKHDHQWLAHIIHHITGNFSTHNDQSCAICRSLVPLEANFVQLFRALLVTNPAQRISAETLREIVYDANHQVRGDTTTRCQKVFEELL